MEEEISKLNNLSKESLLQIYFRMFNKKTTLNKKQIINVLLLPLQNINFFELLKNY